MADIVEGSLEAAERLACIASALAGERDSLEEGARRLREERAALAGDNERLSRTNKKLNAENNGIKTSKTVIIQDSKTIWLHSSPNHQLCMRHQHRLYKKDLGDGNPKGDALRFVSALDRITLGHYRADRITDRHTRAVAARCLERQRSELIHHRWGEERCGREGCGPEDCENCRLDEDDRKTINRHIKRHHREGYFYTTHPLDHPEIDPDNNAVERVNRKFVAIRNDGGGIDRRTAWMPIRYCSR